MWKHDKKAIDTLRINHVSVPLRGLDMWKLPTKKERNGDILVVSVPLRGLDMWKLLTVPDGFHTIAMFQSPCGD